MYEDLNLLEWAQVAALGTAAVFFLGKALAGFFVVDMSLEPAADRSRAGNDDVVAVRVTLKKGGTGSIRLHDAAARATFSDGDPVTKRLIGASRLKVERKKGLCDFGLSPSWSDASRYRLPRGESTTFACCFEGVPRRAPCEIDIVIIGRQWWSPWCGQWRSSLVIVPQG